MNDFRRNDRSGGRRNAGGFGHRTSTQPRGPMFQATCATCGKPCEVPFKPDGSRPIYCREHFSGAPAAPMRGPQRDFSRPVAPQPQPQKPDPRIDLVLSKLDKLIVKVDTLLLENSMARAQATMRPTPVKAPVKTAKKAPAKKPKK